MPHVKMPHLFICHAHVTSVPHIIGTSVRDPLYWYVRHPLPIQRTETERDIFTARSRVGLVSRARRSEGGRERLARETSVGHGVR